MKNYTVAAGTTVGIIALTAWVFLSPTTEPGEHLANSSGKHTSAPSNFDTTLLSRAIPDKSTASIGPGQVTTEITSTPDQNVYGDAVDLVDASVPTPDLPTDYRFIDDSVDNTQMVVDEDQPGRTSMMVSLQEQFLTEPYDSDWANMAEQKLMTRFFEASPEGSQLSEAACRTTFCRIDVSHSDPEAEQRFLAAFAASGEFINDEKQGFYSREVDYNGAIRTMFFYARKGHELPTGEL